MILNVDKGIYSKEVLLKTAYAFTDRVYIHLSQTKTEWLVSWENKPGECVNSQMFENELLRQQLRHELLIQTAEIRKLVLARAFASTVLEEEHDEVISTDETMSNRQEENDALKGWFQ